MKKTALIYALWSKNLGVLRQYLQTRSRVVIMPGYLVNDEVRNLIAASGSELQLLPTDGSARNPEAANALLAQLQNGPAALALPDDAVSRQLVAGVSQAIASDLSVAHAMLDLLAQLAQTHEIELTVLNEDVIRDGKMLALWSRAQGIPVLQVAHGTGINRDYAAHKVSSDHIAVPSQRSAEHYQDLGVPAERIHLVGNPYWEVLPAMLSKRAPNREKLAQLTHLPVDAHWIVWGSTWNAYLSALDNRSFDEQAEQACATMAELKRRGLHDVYMIFKDRLVDVINGAQLDQMRARFMAHAARHDIVDQMRYVADDARLWTVCGDMVVSYNSNMAIEAVLSEQPSINLASDFSEVLGSGFGAEDGVLDLELREVPDVLERLCRDPAFHRALVERASKRKSFLHHVTEKSAADRTAELMGKLALPTTAGRDPYVWQQYLDVESAEVAAAYHTVGRPDLVQMFTNQPQVALDVGCAAGSTAALIKQRFPHSQVWGIELNRAAGEIAAQKIDRVLIGKFEDFNLEQEGIRKGTLDAVLLADVLEHIYNPWDVMVQLRPYMSPTGQLVLSIPNVRNLLLLDDLSKGNWTYASQGLLDITHIRFFTQKEVLKFCQETGYRVLSVKNALDLRLQSFWQQHEATTPMQINTERMTLKNVTRDELLEYCTVQFYVLLEKDPQYT